MADKAADAYRTISEAGEETGLPAHVLRFWESKFNQLRPVKRAGGRRLYRRKDISLILGLKHLLYEEGFTIKGAQKYVKDHGVDGLLAKVEAGAPTQIVHSAADQTGETPLFDQPEPPSGQDAGLELVGLPELIEHLREAKMALDAVRKPTST